MQKNLVLAIVLSSLIYIGWYSYIGKKMPQPAPQTAAQQAPAQTAAQPAQASAATQANMAPAGGSDLMKQAQDVLEESKKELAGADNLLKEKTPSSDPAKVMTSLEAGKADYTFYIPNASIASAVYQGPVGPVELIPPTGNGFFNATLPGEFKLKSKTADTLEFVSQQGPLLITKKFTLSADNGLNSLQISVLNTSARPQSLSPWELRIGPGLATVKSDEKENAKLCKADYTYAETGHLHPTIKELKDEPAQHDWVWAGLNNRYFLAALADPSFKDTRPVRRLEKVGADAKTPMVAVPMPGVQFEPGGTSVWTSQFYIGPKDYPLLQKLGLGLDRAVDFGFFSPLAKLANSALAYFYRLTGNYGVAIIILSLLIQLILSPLSFKSYKAMAVMKKIQPEMKSIQERYKDDAQRMNQEIMALYKRHGTNPLGGCLPMLLQIPVFFSLFTALRNSWNLNGAHFIFWIKDLSAKDPYYVLPLAMGAIMFLQQHLNPQTSDPAQAAMMKWMPVIFTFMFLTFPSGLVLYWIINSTWGFAQSMYLQKKMA